MIQNPAATHTPQDLSTSGVENSGPPSDKSSAASSTKEYDLSDMDSVEYDEAVKNDPYYEGGNKPSNAPSSG